MVPGPEQGARARNTGAERAPGLDSGRAEYNTVCMSDCEEHPSVAAPMSVPVIRVVRRDDPVSAVTEEEAHRRSVHYPSLRIGAPLFGDAEELGGGRWRLRRLTAATPQEARDGLAHHFRTLAAQTDDQRYAAELRAADDVLGWEKIDELRVAGRRYRIVRVDTYVRFGADGPEPPRATDPDPFPPGAKVRPVRRSEDLVVDPRQPVGIADGLFKAHILPSYYSGPRVPEDVRADSRRAVRSHPDGVLLPVEYVVAEQVDDVWEPMGAAHPTPQRARDALAFRFRVFIPQFQEPTEEEATAYARAADELDDARADELRVLDRRLRVVRVESLLRFGPDGPEPPRPSDHDPDPPAELHCLQLREQGLLPDLE